MTEAEWLACDDPLPMLEFVKGIATDRKLRLFAVALARKVIERPFDPVLTVAIDAAELEADGRLPPEEEHRVMELLNATSRRLNAEHGRPVSDWPADVLSSWLLVTNTFGPTLDLWLRKPSNIAYRLVSGSTKPRQPRLLREVIGDPFRSVSLDPAWLTSTAVALARSIYESRAFRDLPVLADALEDAGCGDAGVLGHLRVGGPHARGCWAVDMVLGKV